MMRMTPAGRFVTAVDPHRLPDRRIRERLRESPDGVIEDPDRLSPWVGTGAVALLCAAALVAVALGLGPLVPALFAAAAVAVVGLPAWYLVGPPARAAVTGRRLRRWLRTSIVITANRQAGVARRAPELGERLARAGELTDRLRRPPEAGGLAGILPGVDGDALDRVHHRIVAQLTECGELAGALDEASRRPNLAELVASRRTELAAVCEAVDVQLGQLARLATVSAAIADQQAEALLAERLTSEPAPATALRLPEPASDELPDLVAAADAALELHGLPTDASATGI
jgi:hypothetical protein